MFLDPPWKTGDSNEQTAVQEYFTAVFKDIDQTKANKFLSIHVPEHKMKKLYASLVLRTLTIHLHHSLVDIVRLVSTDRKTLSMFIKLLEKNKAFNPELLKKSKIKDICKELAENKKKKKGS